MEGTVKKKRHESHTVNPTLYDTVADFSQQTSLHGVKYVMQDYIWKPRRFFWAVVVAAQLVGLGFVIGSQLLHVCGRPLLTKVITRYVEELPFPAVTICRDFSNWTHDGLSDFENQVLENKMNRSFFTSMSNADYENINIRDIYQRRLSVDKDFVSSCMFGFQACMHLVQKRLVSETICYTINSVLPDDTPVSRDIKEATANPENFTSLISRDEGVISGLLVNLKLSGAEEVAVKVILHEPDEKIVLMNSEFLQLTRGNRHHIGLSVHKNKFLPAPFEAFGDHKCVEIPTDFRRGQLRRGRYTLRACHDACRLQNLDDYCGCAMRLGASNQCDPLRYLECLDKLFELAGNYTFNLHKVSSCDCPFPCEDLEYRTVLSSRPMLKPTEQEDGNLEITIYFDRLKTVSTEQVPDYTGGDVFASLGGQMGLFLGASIITLAELADLIIRCTCSRIFRKGTSGNQRNMNRQSVDQVN